VTGPQPPVVAVSVPLLPLRELPTAAARSGWSGTGSCDAHQGWAEWHAVGSGVDVKADSRQEVEDAIASVDDVRVGHPSMGVPRQGLPVPEHLSV
jgi:hypothetical protein